MTEQEFNNALISKKFFNLDVTHSENVVTYENFSLGNKVLLFLFVNNYLPNPTLLDKINKLDFKEQEHIVKYYASMFPILFPNYNLHYKGGKQKYLSFKGNLANVNITRNDIEEVCEEIRKFLYFRYTGENSNFEPHLISINKEYKMLYPFDNDTPSFTFYDLEDNPEDLEFYIYLWNLSYTNEGSNQYYFNVDSDFDETIFKALLYSDYDFHDLDILEENKSMNSYEDILNALVKLFPDDRIVNIDRPLRKKLAKFITDFYGDLNTIPKRYYTELTRIFYQQKCNEYSDTFKEQLTM